jgi:hypothetical protein
MRSGVSPIHKNSSSAVKNTIKNVYKREHVRLRAILLRLLGVQHLLLVDDMFPLLHLRLHIFRGCILMSIWIATFI